MKYAVRSGDTVYDIAYNTTGALGAIDAILDSADIETYSPMLETGTVLDFESETQNNAATLKAASVPFNSTYIPEEILDGMIYEFISKIKTYYILSTQDSRNIILANGITETYLELNNYGY